MTPEIQALITAALAEQRASIVAYCEAVGAAQAAAADVAYCEAVGAKQAAAADALMSGSAYRGRMASRAFMARALAKRIEQQLDRVAVTP